MSPFLTIELIAPSSILVLSDDSISQGGPFIEALGAIEDPPETEFLAVIDLRFAIFSGDSLGSYSS